MGQRAHLRTLRTDTTNGRANRSRPVARLICTLALLCVALGAAPAEAGNTLNHVDVACGSGLTLNLASGVPGGSTHTYAFGGFCSLRAVYANGPDVMAHPPLVAKARWDQGSRTYTESLRLLAATTIAVSNDIGSTFTGERRYGLGTGAEDATFRCNRDPVLTKSAHCQLVSQRNATGWGGQGDGFAWEPKHNRPLLLGLATPTEAKRLSQASARFYPPVRCAGLHLTAAHGVPNGETHTYGFAGTCQLYHTKFGDKGREVTHVSARGTWNPAALRATQTVKVLTPASQGGGTWNATFTCSNDPWLIRQARCRSTAVKGPHSPVYRPLSGLLAKGPLGAPVDYAQAERLSIRSAPKELSGHTAAFVNEQGGKGRLAALQKAKLVIEYARPTITGRCTRYGMVSVRVVIRNKGGPLLADTQHAYVHVGESGGAALSSSYVALPEIRAGQTWKGMLHVGTDKAHLSKLPGSHILTVFTGPQYALASAMPYIESPPRRLTVTLPAGYCQSKRVGLAPTLTHWQSEGASTGPS